MAPRIPPLARESWDDATEAAIRCGIPGKAADPFLSNGPDQVHLPNAIGAMVHHPKVAGPFLSFNSVLLRDQLLTARQRELMVLQVAWLTRSEYEWVQHARLAHRYDITAEEIETIAADWRSGDWTPLETAMLEAAEQLVTTTRVDDDTWTVLAAELSEAELVEVLFVVGAYTCLAMVFNGLGVELDPGLDASIAPQFPATAD